MAAISYVTGDAARPHGDGPRLIAHVCNDAGGWGRGFVTSTCPTDRLGDSVCPCTGD